MATRRYVADPGAHLDAVLCDLCGGVIAPPDDVYQTDVGRLCLFCLEDLIEDKDAPRYAVMLGGDGGA